MLLKAEDKYSTHLVLKNEKGHDYLHVKSFDTKTKEAEIYCVISYRHTKGGVRNFMAMDENFEPLTFKCRLPSDVNAYDKKTGEIIV